MGPGGGFGPFGSGYCCGSDGNVVGPAGSGGGACPTNACTGPPFGYATSYPSGVYTITGCPFAGSPWYGGPGGLGGGKPEGWNGWGPWGHGWTFTATRTTTYTVTKTDNSGALITTTAVAVVAEAVSSGATSTVTLTGETALQTANAAAPDELGKVKAMGAALGVVVAVAGLM